MRKRSLQAYQYDQWIRTRHHLEPSLFSCQVSVSQTGTRSRCFINGAATSVRVLKELGRALVDVNGQNASQTIKDPVTQLALLDRIAGTTHMASRFASKLKRRQNLSRQVGSVNGGVQCAPVFLAVCQGGFLELPLFEWKTCLDCVIVKGCVNVLTSVSH